MPYRFPEELQRQIDAFGGDDPGQVDQEVKIIRYLIQQTVADGKYPLANALMSTLAKLSSTQITNEVRAGNLIELSTLVRLAQQMSRAVARRLAGLPNQDVLTDDLMADFTQIIRQEQRLLTHEPQEGDSPCFPSPNTSIPAPSTFPMKPLAQSFTEP
jgi:hypothetical protein